MSGTSVKIISMKRRGDVGMLLHENERNKKMPTPRHKVIHNPIPTSLFLPRPQHTSCRQLDIFVLFSLPNMQTNILKQNKYVGMGKYERVSAGTVSIFNRIILR